jgi:apolipoprotein N-acyltransferase
MHLVVFGEYVPLRKLLPFIKYLTPIQESFEPGREPRVLQLEGPKPVRLGTVICFEDTVPDLYRQFVARGVDLMVNLTNDAWFKDSPAAEMHLANAVFRCLELRRPMIRAANTGISGFVDPLGRITAQSTIFTEAALAGQAPMLDLVTVFNRHGFRFGAACAALIPLLLVFRSRRGQR